MEAVTEGGFSGSAITGAVTAVAEEPVIKKEPMSLINIAILFITLSFVLSLLIASRVRRASKYRT